MSLNFDVEDETFRPRLMNPEAESNILALRPVLHF